MLTALLIFGVIAGPIFAVLMIFTAIEKLLDRRRRPASLAGQPARRASRSYYQDTPAAPMARRR